MVDGLQRRALLRAAVLGAAGAVTALGTAGCTATSRPAGSGSTGAGSTPAAGSTAPAPGAAPPSDGGGVLLAYFSRAGENYFDGGRRTLTVGNTEVAARRIADRIGCDVFEIRAQDPYPDGYDAAVRRNTREQDADARPAIVGALPSLAGYGTVLLGSGIWNVRPPMIMSTFTEALDFSGLTVLPFVTYAVSRLGRTMDVYRDSCRGARFGEPLAIRGEQVRSSGDAIDAWLRGAGLRG